MNMIVASFLLVLRLGPGYPVTLSRVYPGWIPLARMSRNRLGQFQFMRAIATRKLFIMLFFEKFEFLKF